jgi:hypothetical protein
MANSIDDDDLGPPESPIYSNYTKYLWKAHSRTGGVQSPKRSRENTDGPLPLQVEPLSPVVKYAPVAEEKASTVKTAA